MERFDEQIDQGPPRVISWETSPVIRLAVARAWVRLARLRPQIPTPQELTDDQSEST
jgi:hypothetical protein